MPAAFRCHARGTGGAPCTEHFWSRSTVRRRPRRRYRHCTSLAQAHSEGARVVLVRSVPTSESQLGELSGPAEVRALEEAESYLRSIAVRMTRAGVDVSSVTSYGKAADVIESQAQSEGVDIIAMATHGRWALDRVVHGSLAEVVLAQARQPLLVFGPEASSRAAFPPHADSTRWRAVLCRSASRSRPLRPAFGIQHIDLVAVLPPQMIHVDELEGADPGLGTGEDGNCLYWERIVRAQPDAAYRAGAYSGT